MAEDLDGLKGLLEAHGISWELTSSVLERSRLPVQSAQAAVFRDIPGIDGGNVVDFGDGFSREISRDEFVSRLGALGLKADQAATILDRIIPDSTPRADISLTKDSLRELGLYLLPLASYGLLNGGMATSYLDPKRNREFNPALAAYFEPLLTRAREEWDETPKGMNPGFMQSGILAGPSFIELKLRAVLLLLRESGKAMNALPFSLPWSDLLAKDFYFHLSSTANDAALEGFFSTLNDSPMLSALARELGVDFRAPLKGVQPLIAAFTHEADPHKRGVFLEANGAANTPLALPGGHGQNFEILKNLYASLEKTGKRFAYLGNVDNLGYLPDPAAIALLALGGGDASFEFSFRTDVDTKGGILVRNDEGRLSCFDIGQGISEADFRAAVDSGKRILFNCATGLFNLRSLVGGIDEIIAKLPLRFSMQNKAAGRYSQAETSTWEVISILANPGILGVDKQRRFLPAKLYLDTLLTSGLLGELGPCPEELGPLLKLGEWLHGGLERLLEHACGMQKRAGTWYPQD